MRLTGLACRRRGCYVSRTVRTSRLAKPFAALLLVLLALATPGTALAHGFAHLEEHEHGAHHLDARVTETAEATVSAPDHGHDH